MSIGVASGSVVLTLKSEVLWRGPELKERSCSPAREIQSLFPAFATISVLSSKVGRASGSVPADGSVALAWVIKDSSNSPLRCVSTKNLEARLSMSALALTFVESKNSSFPRTNPASKHISTILSKKALKISRP